MAEGPLAEVARTAKSMTTKRGTTIVETTKEGVETLVRVFHEEDITRSEGE